MNLIFIADPLCSWCYGFGKELGALSQAHPDLPLQINQATAAQQRVAENKAGGAVVLLPWAH